MRIIPKRTKVRMELFKGVEVLDVVVGAIGMTISMSLLPSNLPGAYILAGICMFLTVALVLPIDDDRGYILVFQLLKYFGRNRVFYKRKAGPVVEEIPAAKQGNPEQKSKKATKTKKIKTPKKSKAPPKNRLSIEDISPFTAIEGNYIIHGTAYSSMVIEVDPIEFRFYNKMRQDSVIERCLGAVLRTCGPDQIIQMVKIDRPVIYDRYIEGEHQKIADLKEAYLNGVLEEEELRLRVGIIYDRMGELMRYNSDDLVIVPFHYLVFIDENKQHLQTQVTNAIASLETSGIESRQLGEKELVVFLKYSYGVTFDPREVDTLAPEDYVDWILPNKISYTPRTVKYDDLIAYNLRVRDYPMMVGNAWGAALFNMPSTRVSMTMKPIDRTKGIRQIDRSIDELREQGNNTGKTSRLIELQNHVESLSEVLRLLQGENEMLFNVNTYVTVFDYDMSYSKEPSTLTRSSKKVRQRLVEEGIRVSDLLLQQFEGYASAGVSKYDAFKSYGRGIHSSSVAAAFPYVYRNLCDKEGIMVGNSSGVPVILDFFQRDTSRINSNTVIIGKSGSGKSYATKAILSHLAAENSKIFILDPENEYSKLALNLGGKVIDVGSATQGRLNPFHIITGLSDDEGDEEDSVSTSFSTHLQFLEEFYRQILPGIDSQALEYLNNLTTRMYEASGIDEDTDLSKLTAADFPTFDDLYDKILGDFQLSTGSYSKQNLTTLLNYISKFATGGRNSILWNGESSISTQENFIVFNFQSLLANKNNTVANAQMLLVLKWLDNEIIKNRDYNIKYGESRKVVVVIDEAHVFIDPKYPTALDFMYQMAKRIRKYNGMQIVITQNIKDFVGTEELARKSTAIINASQYSFIFPLAPNDMGDLCKLYEKAGTINESEQYDIVNNGRGRAFLITSPTDRTCVDITVDKGIENLFTM